MKVRAKKSISFPDFNWGINEGEIRELPTDKEAQERILQEDVIELISDEKGKPAEENKK